MNCPVCAAPSRATSTTKKTTQRYVVHVCTGCGLAFTMPRPTAAELDAFYTDTYFATDTEGLGYGDYRGASWAEANARAMWSSLQSWASVEPPKKSVLDIGCATGAFLSEAKAAGWKVHGVEKAASAATIAEREFGVPVSNEVAAVAGDFGLITMWHVLEHLVDPLGALVAAKPKIAPGGYLFIELPQWGALGRRKNGARWSQLRPPEHINFFSKRSLRVALETAGWQVLRQESIQPNVTNRAIELIRHGHAVKGSTLAVGARVVERAGLGGYLRCLAAPR
ncbi:MAG: class I SAM-dependent methyltransferase [Acidimicrobiia bacterium]